MSLHLLIFYLQNIVLMYLMCAFWTAFPVLLLWGIASIFIHVKFLILLGVWQAAALAFYFWMPPITDGGLFIDEEEAGDSW